MRYRRDCASLDGDQVVFTYPTGWDTEAKDTVYGQIVTPVVAVQGHSGPATEYKEIDFVTVRELVGGLDIGHLELPTALDYANASVANMRWLIISRDGDRYATAAAIRDLDGRREHSAMVQAADTLYRRLQTRTPDRGGSAATESRLVHTVMTETILGCADLADLPFPAPGRLHRAAYQGDIPGLKQLLVDGADPWFIAAHLPIRRPFLRLRGTIE